MAKKRRQYQPEENFFDTKHFRQMERNTNKLFNGDPKNENDNGGGWLLFIVIIIIWLVVGISRSGH